MKQLRSMLNIVGTGGISSVRCFCVASLVMRRRTDWPEVHRSQNLTEFRPVCGLSDK